MGMPHPGPGFPGPKPMPVSAGKVSFSNTNLQTAVSKSDRLTLNPEHTEKLDCIFYLKGTGIFLIQ